MDPVLSDMFRSIPHAMDSVANAAKVSRHSLIEYKETNAIPAPPVSTLDYRFPRQSLPEQVHAAAKSY